MRNRAWSVGVVFLAMGCTEGNGPTDPAIEAVVLAAASPISQDAVAASLVKDIPTVIAYDSNGFPVAGVPITFAIQSGSGTIEHSLDTTNAAGLAQPSLWRVGAKTSVKNVLSARMTHGDPVLFYATVLPGPIQYIVKIAGDNQIVEVNGKATVNPQARVTDIYENPIAGVRVAFTVTKGGGSVTAPEAITDSVGVVTVPGWTAGVPGDQLLQMAATGVAVSFHALAVETISPCSQLTELFAVSTVASQLSTDCVRNGKYYSNYYFAVSYPGAWLLDMRSTEFDPYLEVRDGSGRLIAFNDNADELNSRIHVLLPTGTYQLVAMSKTPNVAGRFTLSLQGSQPVASGCDGLFVTRGAQASGVLHPLACGGEYLGNAHLFRMHLEAGDSLLVIVKDESYDDFAITIMNDESKVLASDHFGDWPDYRASYVTDKSIDLVIKISSSADWATYSASFN